MKKPSKTINKHKLIGLVAKKINHEIHYKHVANVISLFTDEFMFELRAKKAIHIPNFCSFRLEQSKPRKYHNINKRRFSISTGKTLIKIKLSPSLRNKIVENLDILKTFISGE